MDRDVICVNDIVGHGWCGRSFHLFRSECPIMLLTQSSVSPRMERPGRDQYSTRGGRACGQCHALIVWISRQCDRLGLLPWCTLFPALSAEMTNISTCLATKGSAMAKGRKASKGQNAPKYPTGSLRVARRELQRVETFLRTATATANRRQLNERELALVAEARRLQEQLHARLGLDRKPRPYQHKPTKGKGRGSSRGYGVPASGIRSVSSGGLPGLGRRA